MLLLLSLLLMDLHWKRLPAWAWAASTSYQIHVQVLACTGSPRECRNFFPKSQHPVLDYQKAYLPCSCIGSPRGCRNFFSKDKIVYIDGSHLHSISATCRRTVLHFLKANYRYLDYATVIQDPTIVGRSWKSLNKNTVLFQFNSLLSFSTC